MSTWNLVTDSTYRLYQLCVLSSYDSLSEYNSGLVSVYYPLLPQTFLQHTHIYSTVLQEILREFSQTYT